MPCSCPTRLAAQLLVTVSRAGTLLGCIPARKPSSSWGPSAAPAPAARTPTSCGTQAQDWRGRSSGKRSPPLLTPPGSQLLQPCPLTDGPAPTAAARGWAVTHPRVPVCPSLSWGCQGRGGEWDQQGLGKPAKWEGGRGQVQGPQDGTRPLHAFSKERRSMSPTRTSAHSLLSPIQPLF